MSTTRRKICAGLIPLLSLTATLYTVVWLADVRPLQKVDRGFRANRAVLAIRDSVASFEQFGTELFTAPYLDAYYDKSCYFTQKTKLDKQKLIVQTLEQLCQSYQSVDIFLLAHTNRYIKWFRNIPDSLRTKIRLVYNTGCHNANQGDKWLHLGADAYIGHKGKCSLSPFFYVYFLRRWVSGYGLQTAVNASNAKAELEIKFLETFLPNADTMNYVEQSYGHLYGSKKLIIDMKP